MSFLMKAVTAVGVVGLATNGTLTAAQAWNPLEEVQRLLPIPSIPASVDAHNYFPHDLFVVMDSDRESYLISPGGVVKFTRGNVGDKPTFRAYKDSRNGPVVATKQVFLDGNKTIDFGR